MLTIYLLKGLPASGKSTWARERVRSNPGAYKRVNKDDLRAMLDDSHWSPDNEKFVLQLRDEIVRRALQRGKHVIVDDTNGHPKHEARMRQLAAAHRKATDQHVAVRVIDHFLEVSIEECIERDLKRPNSVGEKVIRKIHRQFFPVENSDPVYREHDPSKPNCVIVDIDGTLALLNGRNPYERDFENDPPHTPVVKLVQELYENHEIILVSGRDEKHRPATEAWLENAGISYKALYMRIADDRRKDVLIKREIYEWEIQPYYNVSFVLDDRDQTVQGWRDLGLCCLQVAPGDF